MFAGYNTNGFAHHRLEDAIEILAELGYRGIALTVDYNTINVLEPSWSRRIPHLRELLQRHQMRVVIETGARFLLDPRRKHQPTLLSESGQAKRLEFLAACARLALELEAEAVSFWSGTGNKDAPSKVLMDRLAAHCQALCEIPVRWAFEPEPGMFIDTMDRYAELFKRVNHPNFGLTLDIGHLQCNSELPISDHIRKWQAQIWNIHIEDMKCGVHDHVMFGEGEIDFQDVFKGLREISYQGGLYVELSRHSHNAVETARKSMEFLRKWF
jgi:sugar phosphate isomerase/epimerase